MEACDPALSKRLIFQLIHPIQDKQTLHVKVNVALSDSLPCRSGVPHGGRFSPHSSVIYPSGTTPPTGEDHVTYNMFADHIEIYRSTTEGENHALSNLQ